MKVTLATARKLGVKLNTEPVARRSPLPRYPNKGEDSFAQQCRLCGLPAFERQYPFAKPHREYRADFAWPAYQLIVEINGGTWRKGGGAHSHPVSIVHDMERTQVAVWLGWYILPFTPDEVKNGHAVDWTKRVLKRHGWRQ